MNLEEVYTVDNEIPIVATSLVGDEIHVSVVSREGLVYTTQVPVQYQHQLRQDGAFYGEWLMVARAYMKATNDVEKGKRTISDLESRLQNKRALAAVKKLLDLRG